MTRHQTMTRADWKTERDRIDLAAVVADLLGPPPGRIGERGHRLWWPCPFHDDRNPSFCVEPGMTGWKCFGCGEHGDAIALVMRVKKMAFPEARVYLTGWESPTSRATRPRSEPPIRPPEPKGPKGLAVDDALALVAESAARLWSSEGAEALAYLTGDRGWTPETIRVARLGWTPGVRLATKEGRIYSARGIVIPWYDRDRLALVKIRQPDGVRPKYAEAYRDRPTLYPGRDAIRVGRPLIVVEGEFDALLLAQELGRLASVATLGSASARPTVDVIGMTVFAPRRFLATDADDAGDRAAGAWPARSIRVRPPGPFNDWTECHQAGRNLARWWADRLGGIESPKLFNWDELAALRWGPAVDDPTPGIMVDRPVPRTTHDGLRQDPSPCDNGRQTKGY